MSSAFLAERADVDGDLAPAHDGETLRPQRVVHQSVQRSRATRSAGQEHHAQGEILRPIDAEATPLGLADQELARELGQDTAAVAGLGVGVDGATMGDVGDRLKRLDENVVILTTGDSRDKADTTGIMLVARSVQRRVHPAPARRALMP